MAKVSVPSMHNNSYYSFLNLENKSCYRANCCQKLFHVTWWSVHKKNKLFLNFWGHN